MSQISRWLLSLTLASLLVGCPKTTDAPIEPPVTQASSGAIAEKPIDNFRNALPQPLRDHPQQSRGLKRPFVETVAGTDFFRGISYGPFREGQAPGGPNPSREQISEDLNILAPNWDAIRVYSSRHPTDTILSVIQDEQLPLKVMVGAWIAPDDQEANAAEVAEAVRLANAYPELVVAVSVGNESQVDWSGHRSDPEVLREAIRVVRASVQQPVSTADDYNFWNKPHSHMIADEVDFMVLHAYAMWNGKALDEAVSWTADTIAAIQAEHPELPIVIGETGWATGLNPEGSEVQHIKAPAGEAEQAQFYDEFMRWTAEARQPFFYFEAFDEPWKGSPDPREVEKHWGLYWVDRTPKAALSGEESP